MYAIKLSHSKEVHQLIWVLECICNEIIPYQRCPSVDLGMHRADWFTFQEVFLQPFGLRSVFRFHLALALAAGAASAPYLAPVSVWFDLPPVSVASDVLCLI